MNFIISGPAFGKQAESEWALVCGCKCVKGKEAGLGDKAWSCIVRLIVSNFWQSLTQKFCQPLFSEPIIEFPPDYRTSQTTALISE